MKTRDDEIKLILRCHLNLSKIKKTRTRKTGPGRRDQEGGPRKKGQGRKDQEERTRKRDQEEGTRKNEPERRVQEGGTRKKGL